MMLQMQPGVRRVHPDVSVTKKKTEPGPELVLLTGCVTDTNSNSPRPILVQTALQFQSLQPILQPASAGGALDDN